jgi:hypothetical protein
MCQAYMFEYKAGRQYHFMGSYPSEIRCHACIHAHFE